MDEIKIERVGGLAGFGLPSSRLKSRGVCSLDSLTKGDQSIVDGWFSGKGNVEAAPGAADAFRYRITLKLGGQTKTVEVPEAVVPSSLVACVKDVLE